MSLRTLLLLSALVALAGAIRLADPCKGIKCPGNKACNSTSGKAVCACPRGLIESKANASACINPCPPGSAYATLYETMDRAPVCNCVDPKAHWVNSTCRTGDLAQWEYLDAHNKARAYVGVKSLVWSDAVAKSAQAWANNLTRTPGCPINHPANFGAYPYGQNIARVGFLPLATPTYAVNLWVAEGAYYTRDKYPKGCTAKTCGHYTQIVWNDTLRVGCGWSRCPDDRAVFVCEYDPPGNWFDFYPF